MKEWIPAFAGMTKRQQRPFGKESTYKRESHPIGAKGGKYACLEGCIIVQYGRPKSGFFYVSVYRDIGFLCGELEMARSFAYGTFVIACLSAIIFGAPEPAVVGGRGDWTLEVKFEHPQLMPVRMAGEGKMQWYWYTMLTLTNRTNDDVDFYPQCELMTDTFEIVPAGRGVPAEVFERVKKRHVSKYSFLEPLEKAGNEILQGDDNTKEVAIIWSDFDARAKSMKLFITGLSNETAVVEHPTATDANGEPVKVYLRKTLELDYALGGEPALRSDIKVTYTGKRWVMR
jgi:hypothetical protein